MMMFLLPLLFICTAVASPLLGKEQCANGPPYWCQNVKTASQCEAVAHCQQNVWNKPTAKSVPCDLCKEVLGVVGNLLKDNATEAEILGYLEKACELIPDKGVSGECKDMVDNYFPIVMGIIKGELEDPNVACCALGLCKSLQQQLGAAAATAQQILSNKIPEVDLSKVVSPFIANIPLLLYPQGKTEEAPPAEDGDVCKDCVTFVSDAQAEAKANSSFVNRIVEQIKEQCDLLGSGMADLCKEYVSQYAPLIIQQLMSMDQKPQDICARAGFCASSVKSVPMQTLFAAKLFPAAKVVPATKISAPAKQRLVKARDSPQCAVCEYVIKEIESMVEQEKTEESVIHAVEKVCSILPATLSAQCHDLIESYGQAIIELLLQQADPKTICTVLGLCKDASRLYIPAVDQARFKAGDFCQVCKMAVSYIDGILQQNATEAEIKAAVQKVCSFLPAAMQEECDQLVEQYEPMLVQLLLQMLDPDFVCTKLGVCASAAKPNLLGSEQCSWGPSFWCKNMDTASRCNAVEHCRRHVWN
ncbi:prosaposin-like isoform X1 [Polyodon spathula]|uniref:prosaposin-like isoform X1 n=1 Tax=Polyodon spathula TaxID=7913 RepID=UPI001B7DA279|nr:prosaposin-like isoform X1 [Polyodon spathula]